MSNTSFTWSSKEIEKLLRRSGFQILGKNQKESIIIQIDGKDHLGTLEADYTVKKGKKNFVVVVRKGEGVFDPTEPVFRRKLMEYNRVFNLHSILLVDPESEEIQQVSFKFPKERGIDFYIQFVVALFIVSLVIAIIWLMVQVRLF